MTVAPVWWSEMDSFALAGWCLAFAATAVGTVGWIKASQAALWRTRCEAHKVTIRRMRAADANRRANARALPAAPKREVPAPRTRFRWIWPGTNPRTLPVIYGTAREHLEADPCLTEPMDETELHEWLAVDEPFLATTRELVLIEGLARNIEWANPPVWVVPHLQETQS